MTTNSKEWISDEPSIIIWECNQCGWQGPIDRLVDMYDREGTREAWLCPKCQSEDVFEDEISVNEYNERKKKGLIR